MKTNDIVKNVLNGFYNVSAKILNSSSLNCSQIQQVSLKTYNSVSLPIFSQLTKQQINSYLINHKE